MHFTPGTHYIYTFPLKLFHYGGSFFEASTFSFPYIPYKANVTGGYFTSNLSSSNFTVQYPTSLDTNDTIHVTLEDPLDPPMAHLHISGKVDYQDQNQWDSTLIPPLTKGAYGDTVLLLFFKRDVSSFGSDTLLDTGAYFPGTGCASEIQYCQCDTGGNFTFDFTANLANWNDYVDVALLPTKGNRAALISTGSGFTLTGLDCGTRTTFPWSYCKVLAVNGATNINYDTVEVPLNFDDGAILRNAQFAQEFDSVRPVGLVPARINFYVLSNSGNPAEAGGFLATYHGTDAPGISITSSFASSGTVSHEWGHWLNYNYSPILFYLGTTYNDFLEGFAEFHQFCVRNYTSAKYGEFQDWGYDNLDESPFNIFDRFAGMPYQPYDTSVCAYGCFLWNVYDKYIDSGFRSPHYNDSDNDDVGEPLLIWEKYATMNSLADTFETSPGAFRDTLQAAVDTSEAVSMQKIFSFMFGDSAPMRPAQVKNVSATLGVSESYGLGGGDEEIVIYSYWPILDWGTQNYDSEAYNPFSDYSNPPDSVHIYNGISSTGPWILDTTVAIVDTPFSFPGYAPYDSSYYIGNYFKVSSYDASGDAYNAPVVYLGGAGKIADGHAVADNASLDVTVHPNPATSNTQICIADLPGGIPAIVELVNEEGNVVATLYNSAPEAELGLCLTLDCSKLPSGIYYAHVQNAIMGQAVKLSVSTKFFRYNKKGLDDLSSPFLCSSLAFLAAFTVMKQIVVDSRSNAAATRRRQLTYVRRANRARRCLIRRHCYPAVVAAGEEEVVAGGVAAAV